MYNQLANSAAVLMRNGLYKLISDINKQLSVVITSVDVDITNVQTMGKNGGEFILGNVSVTIIKHEADGAWLAKGSLG